MIRGWISRRVALTVPVAAVGILAGLIAWAEVDDVNIVPKASPSLPTRDAPLRGLEYRHHQVDPSVSSISLRRVDEVNIVPKAPDNVPAKVTLLGVRDGAVDLADAPTSRSDPVRIPDVPRHPNVPYQSVARAIPLASQANQNHAAESQATATAVRRVPATQGNADESSQVAPPTASSFGVLESRNRKTGAVAGPTNWGQIASVNIIPKTPQQPTGQVTGTATNNHDGLPFAMGSATRTHVPGEVSTPAESNVFNHTAGVSTGATVSQQVPSTFHFASQPAPSDDLEELKATVGQMQEKIFELEAARGAHEDAARRTIRDIFEQARGPNQASKINDFVVFGGVIEVIGGWASDFDGVEESFITMDTAEIDFEAQVNDWVTGVLIFAYENGQDILFPTSTGDLSFVDRFTVDEAFVTIGDIQKYPAFFTAGRLVVPFGISTGDPVADVLTITDPLTVEIFETKEDVVLLGFEKWMGCGSFNAGIYAFNGDTNEFDGEDHVEHYGATMGYRIKQYGWSLDLDVDFINSVFDSDFLTFVFPGSEFAEYAPGMAAHLKSSVGPVSVVAEWNGALDKAAFLVSDGAGGFTPVSIAPNAWQVSLAYQFGWDPTVEAIGLTGTYAAFGYSESFDLAGVAPEKRYLVSVGKWIFEGTRIAIEYANDQDYSVAAGGTGNAADAVTGQLTFEW